MKKLVCGLLCAASLVMVFCIVGGVENGKSLANMLWCIPLLATMWVSGRIGGFIN